MFGFAPPLLHGKAQTVHLAMVAVSVPTFLITMEPSMHLLRCDALAVADAPAFGTTAFAICSAPIIIVLQIAMCGIIS